MKRPRYLATTLIILIALRALIILMLMIATKFIISDPNIPLWYFWAVIGFCVIEIIGLIMIWKWKIAGFYLYVGLIVVDQVLGYLTFGHWTTSSLIWAIVLTAILYLVMRPVWKSFK